MILGNHLFRFHILVGQRGPFGSVKNPEADMRQDQAKLRQEHEQPFTIICIRETTEKAHLRVAWGTSQGFPTIINMRMKGQALFDSSWLVFSVTSMYCIIVPTQIGQHCMCVSQSGWISFQKRWFGGCQSCVWYTSPACHVWPPMIRRYPPGPEILCYRNHWLQGTI